MKKIILKENSIKLILNESLMNNYIDVIMNYLDNNFLRSIELKLNDRGEKDNKPIFVRKIDKKTIEPMDVFFYLQDKFKDISVDTSKRDVLIKQIMKDWYTKYYKKNGALSKNLSI